MQETKAVRVLNPTEMSQHIVWLEDQRGKDRILIDTQQHVIEQLQAKLKEQEAALLSLREEVKRDREYVRHLPNTEEATRKNHGMIVMVSERVDRIERTADRAIQMVRIETERDRKVLTELQQRIEVVAREIDGVRNRLHYVEANRKAFDEHATYVLQRLDELFKADDGVVGKIQALEDARRRIEAVLPMLQQQREQTASELSRILSWQQLADVRWTHQIAEWRTEMDDRARQAEEDARVARQLSKQFTTYKDALEDLRRLIDDRQDRLDALSIEQVRMQNQRTNDLDQFSRLDQAIELLRRRVDEQVGLLRQLEDWRGSDVVRIDDVEGRLDDERERIDDLGVRIVQIEDQHTFERTLELERLIREVDRKHGDTVIDWQKKLAAVNSRIQEQMVDLGSMEEQQKLRQLAELEHQIKELKERHNRVHGQLVSTSLLFGPGTNGNSEESMDGETAPAESEENETPEPDEQEPDSNS